MQTERDRLKTLFSELNDRAARINRKRREDGLFPVARAKVLLLGQLSLLANDKASATLTLAQTGDLDAVLTMEHLIKKEFEELLKKAGMVYDEDSHLIWIPPGAKYSRLFDFENVEVDSIDPESALVSKAVKAPEKNKQLIREAIASDEFPRLVDRISENGGKLEDFA